MTEKGITRTLLLLTFAAAVVFFSPEPARADLRLLQKAVVGFPIDGVLALAQIEPGGPGAHRLAVLNGRHLLGLQWSPQRNAYDATFFVQLSFTFFGSGHTIGASHMTVADVNGDSRNDIVVFASYPSEAVAAYDSATGTLLKTFRLSERGNPVIAQDVDGVPGDEMIVIDSGISAYKGEVRLWHSTLKAGLVPTSRAAAVRGELFLVTGTEVIVLDPRTGQERRRLPIAGGAAVGQSDLDANAEIACSTSSGVRIIDTVTGAVQWTQPSYIGNNERFVRSVTMFDANGDGVEDALVRSAVDSWNDSVSLLNGTTGVPFGGTKKLQYTGAVIGITTGCEPAAVAAIEGGGTTLPDKLWLLDGATLDTKSVFPFDSYGTTGFAIADLDDDGRNELAVAHDGKVSTMRLEPLSMGDTVGGASSPGSHRGMAAAQLDGDTGSEYVIAGVCGGYLGCVKAWDPPKLAPLWTGTMDDGEIPRSVAIADVDGDGAADALSASVAVHGGAKGQFVYAFRGRDGKPLWRSVSLPGSTGRVRVADVEGKGTPQVLALSSTVGIVRLNRSNGAVSGFYEFKDGAAFATYTLDGDPRAKVVAAAGDRLFILDDGQVKAEIRGADVAGTSEIEVADIDGDGIPEILLAQQRPPTPFYNSIRLQVRSVDTLAPLWTSEEFPLLINFGQVEQIAVADIDNDGTAEVVFLSSLTVRVFKTDAVASGTSLPRFEPSAVLSANVRVRSCCASVDLHWDHARPGSSPPLEYRVYRAGMTGEPEVLLATTSRNELVDLYAGGAAGYRYSVAVVDAAGNAAPERLRTEVKAALCHRPAGQR